MELVTMQGLAHRKIGIRPIHLENGVAVSLWGPFDGKAKRENTHHRENSRFQDQFFAQIHQPPTLRIYGQSGFHGLFQGFAETGIGRKLRGMGLRKTAADVQRVHRRKLLVAECAAFHQNGPRRFEGL